MKTFIIQFRIDGSYYAKVEADDEAKACEIVRDQCLDHIETINKIPGGMSLNDVIYVRSIEMKGAE